VKWKVLCRAHLNVLAVLARKAFAADGAGLRETNVVIVEYFGEGVSEFLDVVVAAQAKGALRSIVFETQPQQENEFFFLDTGKAETIFV